MKAEAEVMPWTPPSQLSRFHRAREDEDLLRGAVEGALFDLEELLRDGRELDPEDPRLGKFAQKFWVTEFQAASASGDLDLAELLRRSMVRAMGEDPTRYEATGGLRLVATPSEPGLSAWLYVFQPLEERTAAVPFALDGRRGAVPPASADPVEIVWENDPAEVKSRKVAQLHAARSGTSVPLARLEGFGIPGDVLAAGIRLPRGSYLLVIASPRAGEIRYPFRVLPPQDHVAEITLAAAPPWSQPALQHEFLRVPAGEYLRGGDPLAPDKSLNREDGPRHIREFFISKFEVTIGQYAEFLNDRTNQKEESAWERVPRDFSDNPPSPLGDWKRDNGVIRFGGNWRADWPIVGISALDADAFAIWLTARTAPPGWTIRIPTEDEWEKAARGVDGRFYPWGNQIRRSFCATERSRPKKDGEPSPQPVGMFPVDESVYGVRDLAGNVAEWTADPAPDPGLRIFKGGNLGRPPEFTRSASREHGSELGEGGIGIRLVAVPVEPK